MRVRREPSFRGRGQVLPVGMKKGGGEEDGSMQVWLEMSGVKRHPQWGVWLPS
jgi:hypothetical protein